MGTPAYMAPEQARGEVRTLTTAVDVYGLGATLYEVLAGRPPFTAASVPELLRQVVEVEPEPPRTLNESLDRDLETICLKCLRKDPAHRYDSAEKLAEDLEAWLENKPIAARPVTVRERAAKWVKRRPVVSGLLIFSALALIGLISGGTWFTLRLAAALDLANRGRYAADMNLARRAFNDGLTYQVRLQLDTYKEERGTLADLRGFEWYYLGGLCDPGLLRLRGHVRQVSCVAIHPDGRHLVSAGMDRTVRLWDFLEEKAVRVFRGHSEALTAVAISPDGRWVASGDEAGEVRLWEMNAEEERVLTRHELGIRSLAFHPDSKHLLVTDAGGLIAQRLVPTGTDEFRVAHRHDESSAMVHSNMGHGVMGAYTPDGERIVSAGMDEWVMIWDARTHALEFERSIGTNLIGLTTSPDSRLAAVAGQYSNIRLIDLAHPALEPRSLRAAAQRIGAIAFNPGGRSLALAGYGGRVRLIDASNGQLLDVFDDEGTATLQGLAFDPSGLWLAIAAHDEVHVRRLARPSDGIGLASGLPPIRRLATSADDQLLALGLEDGSIVVWDLPAGRPLQTLKGHELGTLGLAFLPRAGDAKLISVGGDGRARVWDARAGGDPLFDIAAHNGATYSVAFRPDGKQFATGGEASSARTRAWSKRLCEVKETSKAMVLT